ASPIAHSLTFESALSACDAAPEPRPPQPIRPTFSSSPPAAWTFRGKAMAASEPATASDEVSKNVRRDGAAVGVAMGWLHFQGDESAADDSDRKGKTTQTRLRRAAEDQL